MRLGTEYERLSGARACSPSHVFLHHLTRVGFSRSRAAYQLGGKSKRGLGCRDVTHHSLECACFFAAYHGHEWIGISAGGCPQYSNLRILIRIADANVEQKPIELCLREWIGSLLLDRVLRGKNEEWL